MRQSITLFGVLVALLYGGSQVSANDYECRKTSQHLYEVCTMACPQNSYRTRSCFNRCRGEYSIRIGACRESLNSKKADEKKKS